MATTIRVDKVSHYTNVPQILSNLKEMLLTKECFTSVRILVDPSVKDAIFKLLFDYSYVMYDSTEFKYTHYHYVPEPNLVCYDLTIGPDEYIQLTTPSISTR